MKFASLVPVGQSLFQYLQATAFIVFMILHQQESYDETG